MSDDEIEKILSEIDELQTDVTPEPAVVIDPAEVAISEAAMAHEAMAETPLAEVTEDAPMEDILASLEPEEGLETYENAGAQEIAQDSKGEEEGMATHETPDAPEAQDDREDPAAAGTDSELTMTLTGNMTLKLRYAFDGQEVTVGFSDGALRVQMGDGIEFKVPVKTRKKTALKRVA